MTNLFDDSRVGIQEDEDINVDTPTVPLINTNNIKPSKNLFDDSRIDIQENTPVEFNDTNTIDFSVGDVETQTNTAMGYTEVVPDHSPSDVDSRIQEKYLTYMEKLKVQFGGEYLDSVGETQEKDLALRMAELDKRNLTIEQAREISKERGSLKSFERAFANPKTTSEEAYKEAMKVGEDAKTALIERLSTKNFVTSGLTDQLLNSGLSLPEINTLVFMDEAVNPVTAVVQMPVHYANIQENVAAGEPWKAAGNTALMAIDLTAADIVARPFIKGLNKLWSTSGKGTGKGYLLVQEAMVNETALAKKITVANKKIADENAKMRSDYLIAFEERLNQTRIDKRQDPISITKVNEKTGLYEIDTQKVRDNGTITIEDAYVNDSFTSETDEVFGLADVSVGEDNIAIPILKPEKLDALVAMSKSLQEKYPDAFSKDESVIDSLFSLTVDKDLMASEDLMQVLTRHGMSYEEYILGVVGSGSQAGQLLAKFSHIKRARPKSIKEQKEARQKIALESGIRAAWSNTVIRSEGIRRGILVSQWATTARNIGSAGIVQPLASIANLLDAAMVAGRDNGVGSGIAAIAKGSTWSGSFKNIGYIFKDQEFAEEMTEFLLNRPELSGQYEKMFSGIGEIQKSLGRGQGTTKLGKGYDATMSKLEDGVAFLNTPNRWQDHVMRRATFVAELERRVQLEYGVDLQEVIKSGKIQELLNDSPDIKGGADKVSFISLAEDASKKAMDLTFAGTPNNKLLADISNGIVKSGLTVVVPFPRFMMTSLEYMGDTVTGAAQTVLRRGILKRVDKTKLYVSQSKLENTKDLIALEKSKPKPSQAEIKKQEAIATRQQASVDKLRKELKDTSFNVRDREQISRNLVGAVTIWALKQTRESEDMPSDYTRLSSGEYDLDVTAQYPLRQMSWVAEAWRRVDNGTFETWGGMDKAEIMETFLGLQARTGTTNVFVDEITNFISGVEDIEGTARFEKAVGRFVGQFINTYFVPLNQVVTAQRAMGIRDSAYRDMSGDVSLEGQLGANFRRSIDQTEIFMAPSVAASKPKRQFIVSGQRERVNQGLKLFFGLNYFPEDKPEIDYLKEIGYNDPDFSLGSRKTESAARRYQNEAVSIIVPSLVRSSQMFAKAEASLYDTSPLLQKEYGSKKAMEHIAARQYFTDQLRKAKSNVSKDADGMISPLAIALRKYKALNKDQSGRALLRFRSVRNKEPNYNNPNDIYDLVGFGENLDP
jgi:hypothetical protein|tara:strand:- start:42 stop:3725 length:3684 start_codon:yes stop_codon:yes gene_type:complete